MAVTSPVIDFIVLQSGTPGGTVGTAFTTLIQQPDSQSMGLGIRSQAIQSPIGQASATAGATTKATDSSISASAGATATAASVNLNALSALGGATNTVTGILLRIDSLSGATTTAAGLLIGKLSATGGATATALGAIFVTASAAASAGAFNFTVDSEVYENLVNSDFFTLDQFRFTYGLGVQGVSLGVKTVKTITRRASRSKPKRFGSPKIWRYAQ
jgi:hypothetical protein